MKRKTEGGGNPPDHFKIECTLGWRTYVERFRDVNNARVFVEAVLVKDKPRWKSPTRITAKPADALVIEGERLEEIMESTGKGELHEDTKAKVHRFLFGVWEDKSKQEDVMPTKKKTNSGGGDGEDVTTLAELCKRNDWDERKVRAKLRSSGERKEGRWQWPKSEIAAVEAKIRGFLKA